MRSPSRTTKNSASPGKCARRPLPVHVQGLDTYCTVFSENAQAASISQERQKRPSLDRGRSGSATARSSQARAQRTAVTSSPAGVKNTTTWGQQNGSGGLLTGPSK